MRPPEFTGGNAYRLLRIKAEERGFNEAAGIHRRKHRVSAFERAAGPALQ